MSEMEVAQENSTPGDAEKVEKKVPPGLRGVFFFATIASFWLGLTGLFNTLGSIVMPSQIFFMVGPAEKEKYLGVIPATGAFVGLVMTIVAGMLSDVSRSRFGRRKVYIASGSIMTVVFIVLMGVIHMTKALVGVYIILYAGLQFSSSWAAAPYAGLIPDVVPKTHQGTASGYTGLAQSLGIVICLLGAAFLTLPGHYVPVYLFLAGIFLAFSLPTIIFVREDPRLIEDQKKRSCGEFLRTFFLDPVKYRAFYWVFATRTMEQMGVYTIIPFWQYFLSDIMKTPHPEKVSSFLLLALVIVGIPSSIVAGYLADRYGRKNLVYVSASTMSLMSAMLIVVSFHPNLAGLFVIAVVFGLALGVYVTVDLALALDVLPEGKDAARDLGIWHISFIVPQVIAPVIAGFVLSALKVTSTINTAYAVVYTMSVVWFALAAGFVSFVKPPIRTPKEATPK